MSHRQGNTIFRSVLFAAGALLLCLGMSACKPKTQDAASTVAPPKTSGEARGNQQPPQVKPTIQASDVKSCN